MSVASTVVEVLEPYVGHTVADTCVRGTAISLGKMSDELGPADLPALSDRIRRLLLPIAPAVTVDALIDRIEREAA